MEEPKVTRYYDGEYIIDMVEAPPEWNKPITMTMTNKQLIQTEQIRNLLSQAIEERCSPSVFLGRITQLKIPITIQELDAYILPTENEEGRVALMVALVDKNLLDVDGKMKKLILKQRK